MDFVQSRPEKPSSTLSPATDSQANSTSPAPSPSLVTRLGRTVYRDSVWRSRSVQTSGCRRHNVELLSGTPSVLSPSTLSRSMTMYFVWPGAMFSVSGLRESDSLVVRMGFRTLKPDSALAWCDIVVRSAGSLERDATPTVIGSFQVTFIWWYCLHLRSPNCVEKRRKGTKLCRKEKKGGNLSCKKGVINRVEWTFKNKCHTALRLSDKMKISRCHMIKSAQVVTPRIKTGQDSGRL